MYKKAVVNKNLVSLSVFNANATSVPCQVEKVRIFCHKEYFYYFQVQPVMQVCVKELFDQKELFSRPLSGVSGSVEPLIGLNTLKLFTLHISHIEMCFVNF